MSGKVGAVANYFCRLESPQEQASQAYTISRNPHINGF